MDKEEVLTRLRAITRQITCMSNEEFELSVKGDDLEIEFENYLFSEKAKINTKIVMKKIILQGVEDDYTI
jgi:hypothetical protein